MSDIVKYEAHDGQRIELSVERCKKFLVRGRPEYVTTQEFVYFMGVCCSRALNPFAMDAYLIKYSQHDNAAIIVSRGHYQTRARQQPDCQGWNNGIIVRDAHNTIVYREGHLLLQGEELLGGWFEAQPAGWLKPKKHTVSVAPYIKKKRDGSVTQFWQPEKQPMMIEKIAEVQGLRSLWGKEFAHLYVKEEITEAISPPEVTIEDLQAKVDDADTPKDAPEDTKEVAGAPDGPTGWLCPTCGFEAVSERGLKKHVTQKHQDEQLTTSQTRGEDTTSQTREAIAEGAAKGPGNPDWNKNKNCPNMNGQQIPVARCNNPRGDGKQCPDRVGCPEWAKEDANTDAPF